MLLVLDSSGSMAEPAGGGTTKIRAAKQALGTVIDELPDEAVVGLRVYGATVFSKKHKGACTDSQLVVEPSTDNREELREAIASYEPYGETPIGYALQEAADDLGDEGPRSIVLLSDGVATCDPSPCQVAKDLTAAGIDLRIDVVGLGVDGAAREQLRCIAAHGNGTYYNADSAGDITRTLTHVSSRSARPFSLAGQPVTGTDDPATAPVITPGQWVDVLGGKGSAEATRYYQVERTIPGSTIHATVTTRGTVDTWDEVTIKLLNVLGEECAQEKSYRTVDQYAVLSAQAAVGVGAGLSDLSEECTAGDHVVVEVTRSGVAADTSAPIALLVHEEPPAVDTETLPEALNDWSFVEPAKSEEPRPLVAGASFADAPRIESGTYSLDIVPGESQLVRVPLEWGQRLTVRATFPVVPEVEELTGVQGPFADMRFYSPLHGDVPMGGEQKGNTITPGTAAGQLWGSSPEVRYRNRELSSGGSAYLPGDYFIGISMNEAVDGDTWLLPYTLTVEILGQPAGEPTYAEAPAPTETAPSPTTEPKEASRERQPRTAPVASQDGGMLGWVVAGVLLVALLGMLAWMRRSRGRTG